VFEVETDPHTLLPLRAVWTKNVTIGKEGGERKTRTSRREDAFDWSRATGCR